MEILVHWDASQVMTNNEYPRLLLEKPGELGCLIPPSFHDFDNVMASRSGFIQRAIPRQALSDALWSSHKRRGAPRRALESCRQLQAGDSFLIVTGQQPGLLGGPLYSFYKILQACQLASRLNQEREETFIPAFWNAAEDHDFPEIASVYWLNKEKKTQSFSWPGESHNRRPYFTFPASALPLEAMLQALTDSVHPTEFMPGILAQIQAAYDASESYPDFYDRLIWLLFEDEGLLILRPDDAYTRQAAQPMMRREIENPLANTACVQQAGQRLQQVGVSPQVHKRADRTAFFLMEGEERMPVYVDGQMFQTGGGTEYSKRELLGILEARPERFSPSAVLRPIVQDAAYPTAAAILGPGEMAYHFLLEDIYAMHSTPRPAVISRMGCTLVEGRDLKIMEKTGVTLADLPRNPAALVKRSQREENQGLLTEKKQAAHEAVQGYFELLRQKAADIDPTIVRVLEKNAQRILADLEKSEELLIRRAAAQDEALAAQIEGLQAALYPHGGLQERTYTFFAYYFKYGPDFLSSFKALPRNPVDGAHVFIQIP